MLARYTERAKKMSDGELIFALRDIGQCHAFHGQWHDQRYVDKLLAEFDAYTVELHRRRNPLPKRTRRAR